ncbi:hypothetical protein [Pseudoduganella armeniaca]|uniref:hypothetical protein n=1 Tax=Pseudoduganella armeniaca TaxID=2072590 RepID=UPI0011B1CDBE|nr:hypothetical protein [Pseudoduganella armeniaca]
MSTPVNMTAYDGVFGADNNYSAIPATMLNASAADANDFGVLLTNGIKNAAANAIYMTIGGAYASGQLQPPVQYQTAPQAGSGLKLLMVGAVLYFLLADKAGA